MIFRLFRKDPRRVSVEGLYDRIATWSREPALYRALGVPDTLEGRFESLSLHMVLAMRRLRALPFPAGDVSQELVDVFFARLDDSMREMGVGDMSIGKKMKKIAGGFYGRAEAYALLLDAADPALLAVALSRNVAGGGEPLTGLAAYTLAAAAALDALDLDALLTRPVTLPAPASFAEGS